MAFFMATPQAERVGSGCPDVCNAESVSRAAVLDVIARQRAAFEYLNCAGKVLALDSVAGLVKNLPPSRQAGNLVGEKPFSSAVRRIDERIAEVNELRVHFRDGAFDPGAESDARDKCFHEWNRLDAKWIELCALRDELTSGNAEEQPEPREETRPPSMGNPPVTAAAAIRDFAPKSGPVPMSLVRELSALPSDRLRAVSELVLDELEARDDCARFRAI
jgi:hypothetical protein